MTDIHTHFGILVDISVDNKGTLVRDLWKNGGFSNLIEMTTFTDREDKSNLFKFKWRGINISLIPLKSSTIIDNGTFVYTTSNGWVVVINSTKKAKLESMINELGFECRNLGFHMCIDTTDI